LRERPTTTAETQAKWEKGSRTRASPKHSSRELAHWRHPATAWVLRLAALGASRGGHACGFACCFAGGVCQ